MSEKKLCGAKLRGKDRTCRLAPVKGRNRCRLHGGATPPAGPTHHSYRHGRYSVAGCPENLTAHLEVAAADPDLLSLRQEIALIQGLIRDMISRPGGSPSQYLGMVRRLAARARSEKLQNSETVVELLDAIEATASVADLYDEIAELAVKKGKLVENESKRLEQLGQQISAERAYLLIQQTLIALREEVKDGQVLSRVGYRLARILGRSTDRGVGVVVDVPAGSPPVSE